MVNRDSAKVNFPLVFPEKSTIMTLCGSSHTQKSHLDVSKCTRFIAHSAFHSWSSWTMCAACTMSARYFEPLTVQ